MLGNAYIARAYFNTILYSVSGTIVTLFLTCLLAYVLAIKSFSARNTLTKILVVPMFISGGMIPTFLVIQSLGMLNTIWALIIPGSVTLWYTVILRINFENIPDSLRESAYIDGSSNFRILFQITMPLSKAILATLALWAVVGQWNSFFAPLLYLIDPKKYPLQLVLRHLIILDSMRGQFNAELLQANLLGWNVIAFNESLKMTAIIVSIGPIILVYPFLQKYFIKGVLIGSIKG